MSGDWTASMAVAILLFAAVAVARPAARPSPKLRGGLGGPRAPAAGPRSDAGGREGPAAAGWPKRFTERRGGKRPDPAEELQRAAILVAQLSALLRAGRSPVQMWQQAAQIHTVSEAAQGDVPPRRAATVRARFQGGELPSADAAVLAAAARAAAMGRPVGPAMRAALAADQRRVRPRRGGWGGPWTSVAACMETAEASGSPLAAVLERLAAQFEADADAAAARAVALAGPRATAQVLSFLPAAGLLLGALMGADPLGLLLSTPLGAGCLALGLVLTAAGRWWSARMVRSASEVR